MDQFSHGWPDMSTAARWRRAPLVHSSSSRIAHSRRKMGEHWGRFCFLSKTQLWCSLRNGNRVTRIIGILESPVMSLCRADLVHTTTPHCKNFFYFFSSFLEKALLGKQQTGFSVFACLIQQTQIRGRIKMQVKVQYFLLISFLKLGTKRI